MSIVTINPDILGGTPCFTGTRVPADTLFVYLSRRYTLDEFLEQFPSVWRDQAVEALELARRGLLELTSGPAQQRKAAGSGSCLTRTCPTISGICSSATTSAPSRT